MNLRFRSIILSNFGCFQGTHTFQLDRQPGLYFITGSNLVEPSLTSNGVGKSTLFNALFWALTGKTLRVQRPGASIESWHSTSSVWVTLELVIDDSTYLITRTRKPNSLTLNEQVIEQPVINDLIKLQEEALKRTILVGQFVPLFLDLKPEQQSSLFSEALNLDLWINASDKAAQEHKVHEAKKAKLEVIKASLLGRLYQLKEQYTAECAREQSYDEDKKRRIADLKESIKISSQNLHAVSAALERAVMPGNDPGCDTSENNVPMPLRLRERDLARAASSLAAEMRTAQREAELTKTNLTRYQDADEVCPECHQAVNQKHITQKVEQITTHYQSLTTQIAQLKQEQVTTTEELEQVQRDLKQAEDAARLKQVTYIEQQREYLDVKRKHDLVSYKVNELKKELDKAKHMTNPYVTSCEELAQTYFNIEEQVKDNDSQLNEVNELSSIYKYWATAYKEIRLNLIDDTLSELEMVANRHTQLLGLDDWQIEFRTERENKSGTVSHSFTTVIYPNGQDKPIPFESYSGGESQRLQLAVTAALSEILLERAGISTNIEILDEPSRHLSQEGITNLLECLKERATNLGRCIYFIDHNALESGFFDQVITIEKSQSGSRITGSSGTTV